MTPIPELHDWADAAWCGGCGGRIGGGPDADVLARILLAMARGLEAGTLSPLNALQFLAWPAEVGAREQTCTCVTKLPAVPSVGFYLYRLFGENDRLLYVGVSTNLRARLRRHRSRWGDLIKRIEWEEHDSAPAMLDAERKAVADELPALNRQLV